MTRIIVTVGDDYLIGVSDTRATDTRDGSIHDDAQKIYDLTEHIFYAHSGQKLVPALIFENYTNGAINTSKNFQGFVDSFVESARLIRDNTPNTVTDHQFCIFGYDSYTDKFRVAACQSSSNYRPQEFTNGRLTLGNTKYTVFNNAEYLRIQSQGKLNEKVNSMLAFLKKVYEESYEHEKHQTGKEPDANKNVTAVILRREAGAINVEKRIL